MDSTGASILLYAFSSVLSKIFPLHLLVPKSPSSLHWTTPCSRAPCRTDAPTYPVVRTFVPITMSDATADVMWLMRQPPPSSLVVVIILFNTTTLYIIQSDSIFEKGMPVDELIDSTSRHIRSHYAEFKTNKKSHLLTLVCGIVRIVC